MADDLTRARDVLRMVAIGIQQHNITARDVEFLYDDGPKRVSVHRLAVEAMQGLDREIAARADGVPPTAQPKLSVWFGAMPESNGKANWTAILHRGDIVEGLTLDRSEHHDRVRYEADRARHLIGELDKPPCILDYDADMLAPEGWEHPCGVPVDASDPVREAEIELADMQQNGNADDVLAAQINLETVRHTAKRAAGGVLGTVKASDETSNKPVTEGPL